MLKFRPHHFMCALGFQGKGYSREFIENFSTIVATLTQDPETKIEVVGQTDSICEPCPSRDGAGCASDLKVRRLDQAHSEALGIRPGDQVTWTMAKQVIALRMTPELFESVCAPCAWKSQGLCRSALAQLLKDRKG